MKTFYRILITFSIFGFMLLQSCKKDKKTAPEIEQEGTFTDNRDGKTYQWVRIGNQIWMAENLRYTGTDIQHITDSINWQNNSAYDAWSYYDNDPNNDVLYQWEAAKIACPAGWHLPDINEWNELIQFVENEGYSGEVAKALKSTSSWNTGNGTDAFGFNAKASGYRTPSGLFNFKGYFANWWTSSFPANYNANTIRFQDFDMNVEQSSYVRSYGLCIRCIKD